jgi:hypothetical protein
MTDLVDDVVREVSADYYFSLPGSTGSGAAVLVDEMLQLLHSPGLLARARDASVCEVDYPVVNPDSFQDSLRAAIIDRYRRVVRPHPRLEDQAAAFADTIIAQFRPGYVEAALRRAARYAAASEHHMQVEQARWREEEIARNRRKPPRRKLYDV